MAASRKLYVALAREFREVEQSTDENDRAMWRTTVWTAAKILWQDNSGFDRPRFLKASGFTDDDITAYSHMF